MRFVSVALVLLSGWLPVVGSAQVAELSDHSRPRAKVATYHVKCTNGRFGVIRLESAVEPSRVCAAVQDGSRPEQCIGVTAATASATVRASADALCK